jgi:hypothetical protein
MKWFKSFADDKGGFNTFEWSLESSIVSNIVGLMVMIGVVILFLLVLPILIVFIHPYWSIKGMRIANLISIAASTLCLIDYSIGYVIWETSSNNQDLIDIHVALATINLSLIPINLILLFQAKSLFNWLNPNLSNALWFSIGILAFIYFVLYPKLHDDVAGMRATTKYSSVSE